MIKRVAIIGTAPTSRLLAPYDEPDWEIWACSPGNAHGGLPRVTTWFELHAVNAMLSAEHQAMAKPYFAWLKQESDAGKFKVFMTEFNDAVPKAVPFPRDAMIEQFGHNWFTSSVAWMMALAISEMKAGDEIGLFGIDMAAEQEHYTAQKAACLRFMEIAQDRGIVIRIPRESSLGAQTPLYGYDEGSPFGRRIASVLHLVTAKRAEIDGHIQRLSFERTYMDGALEQLRYFQRTWTDGAEVPIEMNIASLAAAASAAAVEAGRATGAPAGGPIPVISLAEGSGGFSPAALPAAPVAATDNAAAAGSFPAMDASIAASAKPNGAAHSGYAER